MRSLQQRIQSIRNSERGTVSIMTTMVLMIVISLIVLGFAQISRRNQRETLDRQLSTQAFYAAESGLNDVRKLIQTAVDNGTAVPDKNGCTDTGTGGFYGSLNTTLDAANNVSYSCLLVDPSPTELRYGDIGTTSVIVPMTSATGANFTSIKLSLQSKKGTTTPITGCGTTTANALKTTTAWNCGYGVLRFDLVPTAGAGLNADSLRNATMTTFAVPFSSGGAATIPYVAGVANTNNLVGMQCTNTGCNLTINGLSQGSYYMRISSLYQDMALQVTGTTAAGAAEIAGAQAKIDVTGKAQDVLRRLQVNIPYRSSSKNELSDYAIQSTDSICKRYSVMDGYYDSGTADVTSGNRLCQP